MNTLKNSFIFNFLIILLANCQQKDINPNVSSPNRQLIFSLSLQEETQQSGIFYKVIRQSDLKETTVLEKAPLGLRFDSGEDFTKDLKLITVSDPIEMEERYELITGKQRQLTATYNLVVYTFEKPKGTIMKLNVKVFDDGVAFQYEFPKKSVGKVESEVTGFHIPDGALAWIQQYDSITTWTPAYEKYYANGIPAGSTSHNKEGWCFPALFKTTNSWVLLSEAGLNTPYYGAHLQAEAKGGLYTIRLPEENEALGLGTRSAILPESGLTPWRVIIVGEEIYNIISSNIVTHLSEPSKEEDTSWIKPGKASWEWWSSVGKIRSYDSLKTYVDLASKMGWKYSLVDAHWDHMEGGQIEDLVDYANTKNVDLLVWYNSGGPNNEVQEPPRDRLWDSEKRKEEFKKIHALGIKGIKVDFFQSDKAILIHQYLGILKDAAESHLLVNFHGCTIPRGWRRTYPNLMTMESVRGAETYRFAKDYPQNAPIQHTILPLTRGVIGPMDYTPVTFSNQQYPHVTTYAHELALAVLFETGILHFADRADSYKALPEQVINYMREVPVVWDEVKYIDGFPGKDMVIARRHESTWYVAGVNGENLEKEISINLRKIVDKGFDFLVISDGENPNRFSIESGVSETPMDYTVKLLPYGGFSMVIK